MNLLFTDHVHCLQVTLVAMMVSETGRLDHDGVPFPAWTIVLVWLLVLFPLSVIFFYIVGRFLLDGGWQVGRQAAHMRTFHSVSMCVCV